MRRYLYIISALLYLNASTEFHQFSRLPFLLKHYREHKADNPSISALDFLKLHYSTTHPADNDDNEDKQLPFKSEVTLIHTDVPIISREHNIDPPYKHGIDRPGLFHIENIPSTAPVSIFHPPRFA
jgi:hypothetical protein